MSKKGRRPAPAKPPTTNPFQVEGHDCGVMRDLGEMVAHRHELEGAIREAVHHARDEHRTPWEEIAGVLGVTRQAAAQRYGR